MGAGAGAARAAWGLGATTGARVVVVGAVTRVEGTLTLVEVWVVVLVDASTGMPLAAASSADLRMARLVWAVTVAGRKLGAAEEDVAGFIGLAGANFLAGVVAAAGALGVACDLW